QGVASGGDLGTGRGVGLGDLQQGVDAAGHEGGGEVACHPGLDQPGADRLCGLHALTLGEQGAGEVLLLVGGGATLRGGGSRGGGVGQGQQGVDDGAGRLLVDLG